MSISLGGKTINLANIGKRAFIKNLGALIGSRLYVEVRGLVEALLGGRIAGHENLVNWASNVIINEVLDELLTVRSPTMIRFKDAVLDGALGAMYFDLLAQKAPSIAELLAMGIPIEEVPPTPQASASSAVVTASASSGSSSTSTSSSSKRPILAEARVW